MSNLPWYTHPEAAVSSDTGSGTTTIPVANTAQLTADGLTGSITKEADFNLTAAFTLTINKTVSTGGIVNLGDSITYTITVTNTTGGGPANNINVTDQLPAQVTSVLANITTSTTQTPAPTITKTLTAGGLLTVTIDTLKTNKSVTITIPCTVVSSI